jgi:hypothetical protein
VVQRAKGDSVRHSDDNALREERKHGYRQCVDFPRALTDREREMLLFLLPSGRFADVDVYRAQVDRAAVTGMCSCGCATIHLEVDPNAPRATFAGTPLLPVEARGHDPSDPSLPVEIILFVREGTLDSLEIVYYGVTPPKEFPAAGDLDAVTVR